jgi:hypothetical protein
MITDYFNGGGQVVIYDANNGSRSNRQRLAEKYDKLGVHVVFLGVQPASICYHLPTLLQNHYATIKKSLTGILGVSRFLRQM